MILVRPDLGKANDGCSVPLMQFVKRAIVEGNNFGEHLRRNGNFIFGVRRPNENNSTADFDVRRRFRKITVQGFHSLPLIPERDEIGTNPEIRVNGPCGYRTVITAPLLQTVSNMRQSEVACPTLGQVA